MMRSDWGWSFGEGANFLRGPLRCTLAYEISKSTGFHKDFGFQNGFLDFKVDFWISSRFLDFKVDFWISYYSEDTAKIYS